MLKQLSCLSIIVLSTTLLSGCLFGKTGYIHDRHNDYLNAKSEPALQVPAQLKTAKVEAHLPIPAGNDFSNNKRPSLLPPDAASVRAAQQNTQAQQQAKKPVSSALGTGADGFPVLKFTRAYSVVWYKLNKALTANNYQVIGTDKKTGVIEFMTAGKSKSDATIYQLSLNQGQAGVLVRLVDQTGDNVASATSQRILKQLQKTMGQ